MSLLSLVLRKKYQIFTTLSAPARTRVVTIFCCCCCCSVFLLVCYYYTAAERCCVWGAHTVSSLAFPPFGLLACFVFFSFLSHLLSSPFLSFSLLLVTQLRGHIVGSTGMCLAFFRERNSALSSLVDPRRIVPTHARIGALDSWCHFGRNKNSVLVPRFEPTTSTLVVALEVKPLDQL